MQKCPKHSTGRDANSIRRCAQGRDSNLERGDERRDKGAELAPQPASLIAEITKCLVRCLDLGEQVVWGQHIPHAFQHLAIERALRVPLVLGQGRSPHL